MWSLGVYLVSDGFAVHVSLVMDNEGILKQFEHLTLELIYFKQSKQKSNFSCTVAQLMRM